jgi:hypothetical protein
MLPDDKYLNNGFYQLASLECSYKYIGQTGSKFMTHFNEHRYTLFRVVIYNKDLPSPLLEILGHSVRLSYSSQLSSQAHSTESETHVSHSYNRAAQNQN